MEDKRNKKGMMGVVALASAALIMAVLLLVTGKSPIEGRKDIIIEVVGQDQEMTSYQVKTQANYLRQAMEEADGLDFSGEEGEFGLMVKTINGDTPDYSADRTYWAFYVNGAYCNYGIDTQPVTDGDIFTIAYTVDSAER